MPETTDEHDLVWEELCINPQKAALDLGREEGLEAGRTRGFQDGRSVGIIKGVEYGMEVGFIHGALQVVLQSLATNQDDFEDPSQRERIEKTTASLSEMLDKFPSPNQIFQNKSFKVGAGELNHHDDSEEPSETKSSDLTRQMQAIRSKFKLLTVQMRWNNFSLKNTMETAKQGKPRERGASGAPESKVQETEW